MSPSGTAEPARILVVDDVEANRELVAQDLEDVGYEVRTCSSGAECLEIAKSWAPEVILLDIQMPVMDGIETCRALKAKAATRDIPVLFLTATRTDEKSVVEGLSVGANDYIPKPYALPILDARVSTQVTIARQTRKLHEMAMRDDLTGLFSRRFLFTSVEQIFESPTRGTWHALGTLVVDVDHFKNINDSLGHLEGDRVLKSVAKAIVSATRDADVVARYGGEEFVVVLPQTDAAGAAVVGEHVRKAIEEQCAPVTASVGAAAADMQSGSTPRHPREVMVEAIARADDALYEAKEGGRNRVVLHEA